MRSFKLEEIQDLGLSTGNSEPDHGPEHNMRSVVIPKQRLVASCLSLACVPTRLRSGIEKKVKQTAIDCPDCGSALFWQKKAA